MSVENKSVEQIMEERRDHKLISLGYYKKDYIKPDAQDYFIFDEETGQYYSALPVTDEQFNKIMAIGNPSPKQSQNNAISFLIKVIAIIIFVIGFIIGILFAKDRYSYNYVLMMSIWAGSFVLGTLMLGVAEIIKLLSLLLSK
ncbi:MAG: hypothetical protein LBS36_04625 [Oscillospiraceae bacterium]|nr:hypothetical protein [Oscillospiraceae bacterium]